MPVDLPEATVAVSATAEREVQPDTFVLVAQISVSRPDSKAAREALAGGYRLLETAAEGLPGSVEVRHGAVSMWSSTGKKPSWHGERSMTLTSSDLATVGQVISVLAPLPAIGIDGPRWQIGRDNPAHAELQAQAVREARVRAERYAAAVDGTLGRLLELSDPSAGHDWVLARSAAGSMTISGDDDLAQLDLTPQPIELSATVNARWALVLPS